MTDKQLTDKSIDIHGKQYVQVKDRINYFNDTYVNGCIQTNLVSDNDRVVFRAKVTPDVSIPERYFTGTSASNPSKSIEAQVPHEVAETSAVGRALAMMGIGVIDSVASVDEMNKANVGYSNASKTAETGSGLTMPCKLHNVTMTERISKKTGNPYFAHKTEDGLCFGK